MGVSAYRRIGVWAKVDSLLLGQRTDYFENADTPTRRRARYADMPTRRHVSPRPPVSESDGYSTARYRCVDPSF
jgi:hypothetical protein